MEHLILETRRKDELREQAIAETKYQKQCDLKVRLTPETYHALIICYEIFSGQILNTDDCDVFYVSCVEVLPSEDR